MTFLPPLKITSLDKLDDLITTTYGAIAAIGGQRHYGIDLRAKGGTPIYAPADAIVKRTYSEAAGGNVLVIDHGNGIEEVFAHLQNFAVKTGQRVKRGDIIGYVGSTGKVTGAHLHWEVKQNGKPINPLNLFDPLADIKVDDFTEAISTGVGKQFNDWLSETVATWQKDNKDKYPNGATWREMLSRKAPGGRVSMLEKALGELNLLDKKINTSDFPKIVTKVVGFEGSSLDIKDPLQTAGNAIGFLLDPANWAAFLALIAGAILLFVGSRMIWSAV